ncbi:hypothetical protein E4U53_008175 [Claviceps sorghi]|nr:hypothetical protein E4U53_008175 [Claviceps sorghi]
MSRAGPRTFDVILILILSSHQTRPSQPTPILCEFHTDDNPTARTFDFHLLDDFLFFIAPPLCPAIDDVSRLLVEAWPRGAPC